MVRTVTRKELPLRNITTELFPQGYELLPGTNQIYELELALAEYLSLSKEELIKRGAYFRKVDGLDTHHYKLCMGAPLQIDKSTSMRLRTFFQEYRFKTGYATHGLFPYRGKFHPQLIKAIMNLIGIKPGDIILDPMMGSGTTNIEAAILGIDSIGIEANPFCCLMAEAKVDALQLDPNRLEEFTRIRNEIFHYFNRVDNSIKLIQSANTPLFIDEPAFDKLFKLCYLDALGYARRRSKKTVVELFPVVMNKYVHALRNFLSIKQKLGIELGKAIIVEGDVRDLRCLNSEILDKIETESIDGIITSPPYSFAIDYLDSDRLQLEYMGYNIEKLREKMIGLRGQTMLSKIRNYLNDMDSTIAEMSRVLKDYKYCVIIVGSNIIQLQRTLSESGNQGLEGLEAGLRIEDAIAQIASRHNFLLVKRLSRPIEGIRNVMRTEEALFFRKEP